MTQPYRLLHKYALLPKTAHLIPAEAPRYNINVLHIMLPVTNASSQFTESRFLNQLFSYSMMYELGELHNYLSGERLTNSGISTAICAKPEVHSKYSGGGKGMETEEP